MDRAAFDRAIHKVVGEERTQKGIGTLSEKTLHAVIKYYLEPDERYHEVPVDRYVADVFREDRIYEIQTAHFDVLRKKLDRFLPQYPVTIVYPIPWDKWVIWVDPETGEEVSRRKSPKKGSRYQGFKELYRIKSYLKNPNLSILFLYIDMEETKILDGWSYDKKRGATKYDRIPTALQGEELFARGDDWGRLVEADWGEFTTKEYQKKTKIPLGQAQKALNILYYLEVVERIGKKGNAYIYKRKD